MVVFIRAPRPRASPNLREVKEYTMSQNPRQTEDGFVYVNGVNLHYVRQGEGPQIGEIRLLYARKGRIPISGKMNKKADRNERQA